MMTQHLTAIVVLSAVWLSGLGIGLLVAGAAESVRDILLLRAARRNKP